MKPNKIQQKKRINK